LCSNWQKKRRRILPLRKAKSNSGSDKSQDGAGSFTSAALLAGWFRAEPHGVYYPLGLESELPSHLWWIFGAG